MRIVLSLDSWPALREFAADDRSDLGAAASLAELAGVDTLRLSINEDLAAGSRDGRGYAAPAPRDRSSCGCRFRRIS